MAYPRRSSSGLSHNSLWVLYMSLAAAFFPPNCEQDIDIDDNKRVCPWYHYGELRLSKFNFWIRIWLHKPHFHKVAGQYSDYFSMYYAPLLGTRLVVAGGFI